MLVNTHTIYDFVHVITHTHNPTTSHTLTHKHTHGVQTQSEEECLRLRQRLDVSELRIAELQEHADGAETEARSEAQQLRDEIRRLGDEIQRLGAELER